MGQIRQRRREAQGKKDEEHMTHKNSMQTTVTKRGRTVIPAAIRRRHQLQEGGYLLWIDDGESIRVVPIPADPLSALRGRGRGEGLLERLLTERREERNHCR
jgi:AbrB family looped-hinge helix DNA binding protein